MPTPLHYSPFASSELPRGNLIIPGTGSGAVVRCCPKTTFSAVAGAGAGGPFPNDIVVVKYLETAMWVSGALVARLHSRSVMAANQYFDVYVYPTSYCDEDPSLDFVGTSNIATVRIDMTTPAAPGLLTSPFTGAIPEHVRVVLRTTQTNGGAAFSAAIGIDLIGRPA